MIQAQYNHHNSNISTQNLRIFSLQSNSIAHSQYAICIHFFPFRLTIPKVVARIRKLSLVRVGWNLNAESLKILAQLPFPYLAIPAFKYSSSFSVNTICLLLLLLPTCSSSSLLIALLPGTNAQVLQGTQWKGT